MPPESDDAMLVPEVASDEALPLEAEPKAGIQPPAAKLLGPAAAIPPSNGELA